MRWTGKFIGDKTLIVSGIILWFEPQTDHQREVFSNEDLFFLIRTMLLTVNLLRSLLRQYIRW